MTGKSKVLIVMPAHNEEGSIGGTIDEIKSALPSFDILIVDDYSTDATCKIAEEKGARVMKLPYNMGVAGAREAGYRFALAENYDIVLQMDADGQHDPKYAAVILKPVEESAADICIGSRFKSGGTYDVPLLRRAGISLLAVLIRILTGTDITDPTSGFRAVNRKVIGFYNERYPYEYPEPEEIVTLSRAGCRIEEAQVRMRQRKAGRSFLTPLVSVYYMIEVFIAVAISALRKQKV